MKRILWLEMKNYLKGNLAVFTLSVLAFACACFTINMVMDSYLISREFSRDYEQSYGNKVYYKITFPPGSAMHMQILSNDNLANIEAVNELFRSDPLFEYRYRSDDSIMFFDFNNPNFGPEDFPRYKQEFLQGFGSGQAEFSLLDDYIALQGLYADQLLKYEPNLHISEGRWFEDGEFYVHDPDNIHLPVILGANYRDLYEIGDIITNMRMSEDHAITLHVIGFLEQGSWFYDNNNWRLNLNNYMVVPTPIPAYDYILEDGSMCAFFRTAYRYFNSLQNARVVADAENAAAVERSVYQIWNDNRQYEFRLFPETSGAQRALAEYKELTISNMAICIFTLLVCVLMFSIQANYKLNKYKKKYGVYMMGGIKAGQLAMIMLQDMVLLFTLANAITYVVSSIGFYGHDRFVIIPLSAPAICVILAMQAVLLCYMGLSGHIKIHKTDMSAALRENE